MLEFSPFILPFDQSFSYIEQKHRTRRVEIERKAHQNCHFPCSILSKVFPCRFCFWDMVGIQVFFLPVCFFLLVKDIKLQRTLKFLVPSDVQGMYLACFADDYTGPRNSKHYYHIYSGNIAFSVSWHINYCKNASAPSENFFVLNFKCSSATKDIEYGWSDLPPAFSFFLIFWCL